VNNLFILLLIFDININTNLNYHYHEYELNMCINIYDLQDEDDKITISIVMGHASNNMGCLS